MASDFQARFEERLGRVYGPEQAKQIAPRLAALAESYRGKIGPRFAGWGERDALLITYGDSLPGAEPPLRELHHFLKRRLGGLISYVHLLPFYPFTSDDGFSVVDFRAIRPDLGSWEDVEAFSRDYRLVFDGVINHVSQASRYVQGYLAGDPAFREFCIALPPGTDTSSVLRTRNLPLLHDYQAADGTTRWLWTTFSRDQVDLNFWNPEVLLEIADVLLFYAARGAAMVRLDAIPYLWKKLGTSCAHLSETHELIKLFRDLYDAAAPHVALLTETNVPHHENTAYFGDKGDEAQMIYNFSLAPLIVWSLYRGNAEQLTAWSRQIAWISPRATYLNITATHDGIGMRPTEGILSEPERKELVQLAFDRNGDMTGKRNADGSVAPYELNLSYFDAINDPRHPQPQEIEVRKFLVSQAIPIAMMGVPGIYVHSLFGSRNDLEGVKRTGRARSINRAPLPVAELEAELEREGGLRREVFAGIRRLLEIRAAHSAFHPDARQEVLSLHPALFAFRRTNLETGETLLALHNVSAEAAEIELPEPEVSTPVRDLLSGQAAEGRYVTLAPFQVRWLLKSR
jgi:sucrose phosphorylase